MEIFYSDRIEADRLWLDSEESAHCVRVLPHRSLYVFDKLLVMGILGKLAMQVGSQGE